MRTRRPKDGYAGAYFCQLFKAVHKFRHYFKYLPGVGNLNFLPVFVLKRLSYFFFTCHSSS